jgi:hypothetical protein
MVKLILQSPSLQWILSINQHQTSAMAKAQSFQALLHLTELVPTVVAGLPQSQLSAFVARFHRVIPTVLIALSFRTLFLQATILLLNRPPAYLLRSSALQSRIPTQVNCIPSR